MLKLKERCLMFNSNQKRNGLGTPKSDGIAF